MMYLSLMTLETCSFEDYLSFLTDVLELEVREMTENSLKLVLKNSFLEIKKSTQDFVSSHLEIEFLLNSDEFEDLIRRARFYYYRKGHEKFLFSGPSEIMCEFLDPDGRVWRFLNLEHSQTFIQSSEMSL